VSAENSVKTYLNQSTH